MEGTNETIRTEKPCTKCKEIKPLSEYTFDKRNLDGRVAQCKACMSAQRRERYRTTSREKEMEQRRAKRARAKAEAVQ